MPLRHFLFREFNGKLLLLSLAQDCERHFSSLGESLQELSQLTRLEQNLVIQHFEDVVLLNAGSRSGAVRLDIVNDQTKAFRQAKLITHDRWHLRCVHAEVGDRNLRTLFIMTRHSWFVHSWSPGWTRWLWRLWRHRRWLRKCCDRQQRNDSDSEYGFHFHGLFLIRFFLVMLMPVLLLEKQSNRLRARAGIG